MKPLPKNCIEAKDAVIVVQSCDEETANIGIQWRGKITYYHVALPSLEREWQKVYYSDVRPEIFDSILRENKPCLLEIIRRLNAVERRLAEDGACTCRKNSEGKTLYWDRNCKQHGVTPAAKA